MRKRLGQSTRGLITEDKRCVQRDLVNRTQTVDKDEFPLAFPNRITFFDKDSFDED